MYSRNPSAARPARGHARLAVLADLQERIEAAGLADRVELVTLATDARALAAMEIPN